MESGGRDAMEGDVTIRTYRGNSPAEALAKVKKDLGADAVILNTRTQRVGGVLGLGVKTITEITAALPGPGQTAGGAVALGGARRPSPTTPSVRPARVAVPVAAGTTPGAEPPPAVRAARDIEDRVTVGAAASDHVRMSVAMESEIAAIRRMVGQLVCASRMPAESLPAPLENWYLRLMESEVPAELAARIIGEARAQIGVDQAAQDAAIRRAILGAVARMIPVHEQASTPARGHDGRPHTIVLVGPTGVGKTTTLAKLAATWKLRHGLSVGVVTADTYRIAAVDQLRVYAGIMNLPLEVVSGPSEMARACRALEDRDVILIDTAGRSPRDNRRLEELRTLIGAATPDEVHMVVSATASPACLRTTLEQFGGLGPTHTILTKLDEAPSLGGMLAPVAGLQARLSYLTTGQEVPDQIEPACPNRFAKWIVEGQVAP